MICDIEEREKPYHPSQMTRFRNRVGPERLEEIMNKLVIELVEQGEITGEYVALDATFIKAWSKRDPVDDSHGYSDPESSTGVDRISMSSALVGFQGFTRRRDYLELY